VSYIRLSSTVHGGVGIPDCCNKSGAFGFKCVEVAAGSSRRHRTALVDPIPAGLKALNPALAVTGKVPRDPKAQT